MIMKDANLKQTNLPPKYDITLLMNIHVNITFGKSELNHIKRNNATILEMHLFACFDGKLETMSNVYTINIET